MVNYLFYKTPRVKVALNLDSFFHLHDGLIRHRVTGCANGVPLEIQFFQINTVQIREP
jgi:hypothetical protein